MLKILPLLPKREKRFTLLKILPKIFPYLPFFFKRSRKITSIPFLFFPRPTLFYTTVHHHRSAGLGTTNCSTITRAVLQFANNFLSLVRHAVNLSCDGTHSSKHTNRLSLTSFPVESPIVSVLRCTQDTRVVHTRTITHDSPAARCSPGIFTR